MLLQGLLLSGAGTLREALFEVTLDRKTGAPTFRVGIQAIGSTTLTAFLSMESPQGILVSGGGRGMTAGGGGGVVTIEEGGGGETLAEGEGVAMLGLDFDFDFDFLLRKVRLERFSVIISCAITPSS